MPPKARIFYLDNLKVALTILVIAHHVGQAYGPTGGFWPVQEAMRAPILGPFFTVNRSFFMSLFFMISGYFMIGAYERKGPGVFIRSRLMRLGLPVLVFATLMIPARIFVFGEHITRWDEYFNAMHLWYLEHVLLFSLAYALWRRVRGSSAARDASAGRDGSELSQPESRPRKAPGMVPTLACILGVAALSWLIRIWSPIDRWMNLLGFIRVAFADLPRDLSFFVFGALAFKKGWLESYPTRRGMVWLALGLAAGAARYAAWILFQRGGSNLDASAYGIVYPIWEAFLCFGMCIGLTVLFREFCNAQHGLGKALAANQYSAYFWHPMLIVGIQIAILALALGPFAKFALVTLVGVPLVFLWSALLRRLSWVRAVL